MLEDDSEPYGDLARFLPLRNHTVFAYQVQNEDTGETGLLVMQVRHRETGLVELLVGGTRQWLQPTESAVRHTSGGSLLRMPLTEGSSWKGPSGVVKLRALGRRVDVPAGSFQNCIETEEDSTMGDSTQRIVTSYCPDIGITRLEVETTVSNSYRREVAELQSWGPMLDFGEDGITVTK